MGRQEEAEKDKKEVAAYHEQEAAKRDDQSLLQLQVMIT